MSHRSRLCQWDSIESLRYFVETFLLIWHENDVRVYRFFAKFNKKHNFSFLMIWNCLLFIQSFICTYIHSFSVSSPKFMNEHSHRFQVVMSMPNLWDSKGKSNKWMNYIKIWPWFILITALSHWFYE